MTQIPDLFDASLGSSEGPRLSSGTVKGLNTVGKGKIHLAGTYRRPDSLDLSNTQLSVDLLLYERGAGGAGGLGELVMAVCCGHRREIVPPPMPKGKPITPITLIRRGKSPWHAVYETRRGAEPRIEIHLISHPESPLLHVRVNIDKASIAVPAACQNGKERVDLGHRITLQNKISHVSRSLISRQGWDCVSKDDGVNELRLLEVP
jgi:hypothetical protein